MMIEMLGLSQRDVQRKAEAGGERFENGVRKRKVGRKVAR